MSELGVFVMQGKETCVFMPTPLLSTLSETNTGIRSYLFQYVNTTYNDCFSASTFFLVSPIDAAMLLKYQVVKFCHKIEIIFTDFDHFSHFSCTILCIDISQYWIILSFSLLWNQKWTVVWKLAQFTLYNLNKTCYTYRFKSKQEGLNFNIGVTRNEQWAILSLYFFYY